MSHDLYSFHELLDRTNMVLEIVDTHLLGHPLMDDPQRHDLLAVFEKLHDAAANLGQAYQLIGNLPETFST